MMRVTSAPWPAFADAVRARFPEIAVHVTEPGISFTVSRSDPEALPSG